MRKIINAKPQKVTSSQRTPKQPDLVDWDALTPESIKAEVVTLLLGQITKEAFRDQYGEKVLLYPRTKLDENTIRALPWALVEYLPVEWKIIERIIHLKSLLKVKADKIEKSREKPTRSKANRARKVGKVDKNRNSKTVQRYAA